MQRTPVDSTALTEVGYEDAEHTLEVEFRNGRLYRYFDVPKAKHTGLMEAPSHGEYFTHEIRNAGFRYERLK